MSRYDILLNQPSIDTGPAPAPEEPTPPLPAAAPAPAAKTRKQPTASTARPSQQVADSPSSPVDQSTDRSTEAPSGELVPRPKAFYITRRLDRRLERAVQYLQEEHGIVRVDRSTVVNVLLDRAELFTDEHLDQIAERVVRQLTSRLTR